MKKQTLSIVVSMLLTSLAVFGQDEQKKGFIFDPAEDLVGQKTAAYFGTLFAKMEKAAAQSPDYDTFRTVMKPAAESIKGFYGGTLLDADWIIKQVYYPSHFLARGFDLKKVKELAVFIKKMKEKPEPQLSEPGHGSIIQPRLIAMRYPVVKDGKVQCILSMMVRTEEYLKAVGLDQCKAYRITCLGVVAEEKGDLSKTAPKVRLELPSTEWVIEYEK